MISSINNKKEECFKLLSINGEGFNLENKHYVSSGLCFEVLTSLTSLGLK